MRKKVRISRLKLLTSDEAAPIVMEGREKLDANKKGAGKMRCWSECSRKWRSLLQLAFTDRGLLLEGRGLGRGRAGKKKKKKVQSALLKVSDPQCDRPKLRKNHCALVQSRRKKSLGIVETPVVEAVKDGRI